MGLGYWGKGGTQRVSWAGQESGRARSGPRAAQLPSPGWAGGRAAAEGHTVLWEAGWWAPRVGRGLGAWLLTADITASKGRMGARRSVGQV